MIVKVWEQQKTRRVGVIIENEDGRREMLLTPQDFETMRRALNGRPKKVVPIPYSVPKHQAVTMAWRGDARGKSWKLRQWFIRCIMPELAETLDRKY